MGGIYQYFEEVVAHLPATVLRRTRPISLKEDEVSYGRIQPAT